VGAVHLGGQGSRVGIADQDHVIDACPSIEALGALGKRLYALALTPDQAGVAWSHYHLRQQALEAQVVLGRPARALLAAVEQALKR